MKAKVSRISITSTELNRRPKEALAAAKKRPLSITEWGRASHVLMTCGAYKRLKRRAEKKQADSSPPEAEK